MPTHHESFWQHERYAFVGHRAAAPFPVLSYRELRAHPGKTVYAVDPDGGDVEGDRAYPDLAALPEPVDGAVIEVPREETAEWVARAADAGIPRVWIHMGRDTPEAVALAEERGLDLHTDACAVMYVKPGFGIHGIHRWIEKARGRY